MSETYKRGVSFQDDAQWALGDTGSTLSGFSQSEEFRLRSDNNLQYIPKKEEKLERPLLQATLWELLCYFRIYTATTAKTQLFHVMEQNINTFFWYRLLNTIFKNFPHVFIQVFIAAYVPQEHFYIDKMNPLTYGYNFVVIAATFLELLLLANSDVYLIDYIVEGLTKKCPWNFCSTPTVVLNISKKKYTVNCLTLEQFGQKVRTGTSQNLTLHFVNRVYFFKYPNSTTEYFQISQILHYRQRIEQWKMAYSGSSFGFYFLFIWLVAAFHYNQLFKKTVWKILHISNWIENAIYMASLAYIVLIEDVLGSNLEKSIIHFKSKKNTRELIDIDFVSESLNAPPVAHVLFARSTTEHTKMQYNYYSASLIVSNCFYDFFIGSINILIIRYCEVTLGIKIAFSDTNINSFFYFYPIFFSRFVLGNIFIIFLFIVKLLTDFYMFVITLECLIECIVYEWRYAKKLMVSVLAVLMALLFFGLVGYRIQVACYVYFKSTVTVVEIFCIYLLYPLGRLIEDMVFHSGTAPNSLRVWSLRFVPIYVAYKMYTIITQIGKLNFFNKTEYLWWLPITFMVLGMIYAIIITVFVDKRSWTALFCPEPEWGPIDNVLRYCRKIFRSDEYIGSQADRTLSRYMISKAEAEVYRLDIRYDAPGRRSWAPSPVPSMRYEDEKKNV